MNLGHTGGNERVQHQMLPQPTAVLGPQMIPAARGARQSRVETEHLAGGPFLELKPAYAHAAASGGGPLPCSPSDLSGQCCRVDDSSERIRHRYARLLEMRPLASFSDLLRSSLARPQFGSEEVQVQFILFPAGLFGSPE